MRFLQFSDICARHKNFAPKLKGRYLSSNVNITLLDEHNNIVNVPVGSAYYRFSVSRMFTGIYLANRSVCQVQDKKVRREVSKLFPNRRLTYLHQGSQSHCSWCPL